MGGIVLRMSVGRWGRALDHKQKIWLRPGEGEIDEVGGNSRHKDLKEGVCFTFLRNTIGAIHCFWVKVSRERMKTRPGRPRGL